MENECSFSWRIFPNWKASEGAQQQLGLRQPLRMGMGWNGAAWRSHQKRPGAAVSCSQADAVSPSIHLPCRWQGQSDLKISCHCFNEAGHKKPAVGGFYGEDASKKPELMNVNGPIPFGAIKQSTEAREHRIPIERPCPVLPLAWWFLLWNLSSVQTEGQAMPLTLCLTCLFDDTKALHPHIQG